MAQKHLILAYAVTWILHLGYVAWLGLKWKANKKLEAQQEALFRN